MYYIPINFVQITGRKVLKNDVSEGVQRVVKTFGVSSKSI